MIILITLTPCYGHLNSPFLWVEWPVKSALWLFRAQCSSEATSSSVSHKIHNILYGVSMFINVFTRVCHFQSWARCIKSTPCQPMTLKPISILSSHLCLVFKWRNFRFSPYNLLLTSLLSHACHMLVYPILLDFRWWWWWW
jgi:hypothetical protein